jgi:Na+-driven multidrug efflux pump
MRIGAAVRLEYLLFSLAFSLGASVLAMVGTSLGAGDVSRAGRVTWIATTFAAPVTGCVGLCGILAPGIWAGFFTKDPDVHAFAARYLLITGLAYPCLGVALTLASAFQAAGRPLWPILAVTTRTFVVTLGGWIAIHFAGAGFSGLAVVAALGVVSAAAKPSIRLKSKEPLAAL